MFKQCPICARLGIYKNKNTLNTGEVTTWKPPRGFNPHMVQLRCHLGHTWYVVTTPEQLKREDRIEEI